MSALIKQEEAIFTEQIADIKEGALAGNTDAQTAFGKSLLFGWGIPKDEAQAYTWLEKAQQQGDQIAAMYMGHCLLYGLGVEAEERKGYQLLNAALDFNYPGAGQSQSQSGQSEFSNDDLCQLFLDLGDALEKSLGVYKNYRVAVYYFDMLADWGQPIGAERKSHYKKSLLGWKKID